MKKLLYFALIFLIIPYVHVFCQDEAEPFTNNNNSPVAESTIDPNTVTTSDIFSGEPTPNPQDANGNSNVIVSMSDVFCGMVHEQGNTSGVKAVQLVATATPIPQSDQMYQTNDVKIQEQAKTREQIEQDVKALYKEGKKYYDIEDYDGAAEIWDRIITNYPTSKDLYDIRLNLGQAYEYSGAYDKAIVQYQRVIAEKPKADTSLEAQYRLAACYTKLEKWPYSMEIYRDIIQKAPTQKATIRAYFNMAQVYMKQGKMKKVEIIYKNIIRYYPNSENEILARFQLASLYAQTNRFKSSIKEYKMIKYKFKDSDWAPQAAMHIGDTYKLEGDYKSAKDAYSKVMYEYYMQDKYVQQAEERIEQLKHQKELENRFNEANEK